MGKLNEKRIELPNPYPVGKKEIIDLVERSTRLVHTATDDKTIQLYIYSNGSDRPEAFAEVEITSIGYILHGAEGYDYQGSSMKEFEDDLRDVVFNFDATTSKRFGENNTIDKEKLFESLLNESSLKEYFFYAPPHHEEDEEDTIIGYIAAVRDYQTQKTKYVDDDGNVCNSKSQAKVFDTKGKADNYSYDHCPEGWTHFVVALKKSDILNEAETTKYMACCYDPEDYYEETNYIDEDGELSCNSSGAKLFNTEDEAIEYADETKPIGWMSFAMPFNTTLNEADDTYKAKVNGKWLKGNKLVKDKKDADTFESKTEPTQRINQMKKDGKLNKNAKPNIVKESHIALFDDLLKEYLLEDIEDFPKNTRAMYRFARRRHDDTGAIRKVSKEPYWVHPEGVAKIVMEHGGSDLEIKAAMAHDVLEDTGESYEDMVEKFGEKVASIVKEVTNDKDEIAKVGKEKYISEELCRLSPEALTVKLADMLYNMKDSPTEKNYERMRKNIAFLMMNRQLDGKHLELAQEIMEV